MKWPRRFSPPYLVILLATAVQLALISQPLGFLLTNILPDDAFYYFQIARNIMIGEGSTFDGVNLTNGYHPLWMLILLPVFKFLSVGGTYDVQPIYATLLLCVVLNVGTAVLLYGLIRRIAANVWVRTIALAAWCLNPFVLYETVNGLETPLALFLLLGFITLALRAEGKGARAYVLVGIAAGLLVLARLDMICFVLAYGVWMLMRHGVRQGLGRGMYAAIPAVVIVLVWCIYNTVVYGMFLTSASGGNELVNRTLVVQDNGEGFLVMVRATLYMLVTYGKLLFVRTGAAWLAFFVAGLAAALWMRADSKIGITRRTAPLLVAMFGGFILLFAVNAGLRFTGRSWYFISGNLFLALAVAWVFAQYAETRVRTVVMGAVAALMLFSFALSWQQVLYNQMQNQASMYDMAVHMRETLPVDTTVGVFNAGIAGYFSGLRVVNLDGLVNNNAFEAMGEERLWAYIQEENISYIADFPIYITYRYRAFFGIPDVLAELTPVTILEAPGSARGSEIVLYSLVSRP